MNFIHSLIFCQDLSAFIPCWRDCRVLWKQRHCLKSSLQLALMSHPQHFFKPITLTFLCMFFLFALTAFLLNTLSKKAMEKDFKAFLLILTMKYTYNTSKTCWQYKTCHYRGKIRFVKMAPWQCICMSLP